MPEKSSGTETIRHNFKQPTPRASGGHECSVPGKGPAKNPTLSAGKGSAHLPNASVGKGSGKL